MSEQLAERVGARAYAEHEAAEPGSMAFAAAAIAAFKAAAIVDLAGVPDGKPFDRLAAAIDSFAPPHLPFRERFDFTLRELTIAQLGEQRADHWHDLRLSRRALALYPAFRIALTERHPELLAAAGEEPLERAQDHRQTRS